MDNTATSSLFCLDSVLHWTCSKWNWNLVLTFLIFSIPLLFSEFIPAYAQATIHVNTTDDELNSDGDCSLREAITAANTDAAVDGCSAGTGTDIIELNAGSTYTFSVSGTGEELAATGDLDLTDADGVTIQSGTSGTKATIDANSIDRVFDVRAGNATFTDLTVTGGSVAGPGGGIQIPNLTTLGNVTLTRCSVSSNTTTGSTNSGGGLYADYGHETTSFALTITESTISNNQTANDGGGLMLVGDPEPGAFSVTITDSEITNNTSSGVGAGILINNVQVSVQGSTISGNNTEGSGDGGGIYTLNANSQLTITNSTISGNIASDDGGGIFQYRGSIYLNNSTVAMNSAQGDGVTHEGGGIFASVADAVEINSSIIALNLIEGENAQDCDGTLTSTYGHNLLWTTTDCTLGGTTTNNITGQDPLLDALDDYGGPTQTHLLANNSPALDAGTCDTGATVDQRDVERKIDIAGKADADDKCDIGAVEVPALTVTGTAGQDGSDKGWRMYSNYNGTDTRGNLFEGITVSDNDEVRTYDESAGTGNARWINVQSGDNLTNGVGFLVYLYDDATDPIDTQLSLFLNGDVVTSGDVTVSSLDVNEEWIMPGNPYASSYDLSSLPLAGGDFKTSALIWNPSTGSYQTETQAGDATDVIALGQAIFIQRNSTGSGGTSITWDDAGITTGGNLVGKHAAEDYRRLGLTLEGFDPDGKQITNDVAAGIYFHRNATYGWDSYDMSKLTPLVDIYATLSLVGEKRGEAEPLSLAGYPYHPQERIVIPLQIDGRGFSGEMRLSWPEWNGIPPDWQITLTDLLDGTTINLRQADEYRFDYESPPGKVPTQPEELLQQPMSVSASNEARFELIILPNIATTNEQNEQPTTYALEGSYPNPFNPSTQIRYSLAETVHAMLAVYDTQGRQVAVLVDSVQPAGRHETTWNGRDAAGRMMPSGLYFYRLNTRDFSKTRSMLLVK